jgi:hypothetical protein
VDSPVVVGHPYPIVEVCDQLPERLRCARHDALSKAVARAQIHKVRALAVAVDEFAAAEERPTVVIDHVLHFTPYSRNIPVPCPAQRLIPIAGCIDSVGVAG